MRLIDLNADLGESYGPYTLGADDALLAVVTSANIACGFHAGDPLVMKRAVEAALARGVHIGAHPGLPDLQGFGRRRLSITPDEAYAMTLYQIGALAGVARAAGGALSHVKPHGALYNMAEEDDDLADAIAGAARDFDARLIVYALSGGRLARAALGMGLTVAHEVFADRGYAADGTLLPRSAPGAVIHDADAAAERMIGLIETGEIAAVSGEMIALRADTICTHGDGAGAVEMARRLRERLTQAGIGVAAFDVGGRSQ